MTHIFVLLAVLIGLGSGPAWSTQPVHGLAMHGTPKHAAGFSHFPYVRPDAPRGGRLTQGMLGTFDSLNPFIIRGVSATGLREYVFESLMARSGDEPFTLYGLIAESVELPPDRAWVTFHLRPEARFADGQPITPDDVLFSHALLKEKGWPYHRSHYGKVAIAEKIGERSVRFTFESAGDREVPLLLALMPILPRHRLDAESFERTTLEPPLGSGPYSVARVDAGRSITYRRNDNWWARDLPVMRGRFNFDEIRVEYFRDASSMFEAFKAGELDIRQEDDPGRWVEGYDFAAVTDGHIIKREFDTGLPSGMSGLVFNTRRPAFKDPRVRRAFNLLFDAEWMNRNLFNGLFKRTESYFERSYLSSHGRPADARERALLAPFADFVKPEVLEGTYRQPVTRRQPRQPEGCAQAAAGSGLRDQRRAHDESRPAAEFGIPGADPGAGTPAAQLRAHARQARHRVGRPASGQRTVQRAPEEFRLRHGAVELDGFALARQRADQPLEQQGR